MKLLGESTAAAMARLVDVETEAKTLLSELDTLETRLQKALEAVSIDCIVGYLSIERERILEDEKRVKIGVGLAAFPALGIYGLTSLFRGEKPDWGRAVSEVFREQPFGDVRIEISRDSIKAVNVSKMAREQNVNVAEVVTHLEARGNEVLTWSDLEARAGNLRMAALNGEAPLLGTQEARLQLRPPDLPRFASDEIRQSG
jgi:hypothetical protein